jgi:hypothetical protein
MINASEFDCPTARLFAILDLQLSPPQVTCVVTSSAYVCCVAWTTVVWVCSIFALTLCKLQVTPPQNKARPIAEILSQPFSEPSLRGPVQALNNMTTKRRTSGADKAGNVWADANNGVPLAHDLLLGLSACLVVLQLLTFAT